MKVDPVGRPHHTNPRLLVVVAAGGTLGTAGRYALGHLLPAGGGLPVATLSVNLIAAFALGLLLEALVRAGAENQSRRVLRLGLGTGVLGALSTYSSLALEIQDMLARGQSALALAYGLGSVVVGLALCFLGVLLAAHLRGASTRLLPARPDQAGGGAAASEAAGVER